MIVFAQVMSVMIRNETRSLKVKKEAVRKQSLFLSKNVL